jgi:hypothetical protein
MRVRGPLAALAALSLLLPVTTAPAQAQDGFLFGRPDVQLTLRAGPMLHRAQSDLFDFITSELTLNRGDFRAPAVGGELSVTVHPQLDLSLGLAFAGTERRSEFRDWVGDDDLPIEQVTTLRTVPLSLSSRYYPLSRGRSVSSLAWVPARTTPYVGAGVDLTWYRLQMEGEFVHPDLSITYQDYRTNGRAATVHARAGLDHWFTPRVGLNLEGRYTHGSGSPEDDFIGYNSLDLSGVHAAVGLSVRW